MSQTNIDCKFEVLGPFGCLKKNCAFRHKSRGAILQNNNPTPPEIRNQIVSECIKDLVSPTELAKKWGVNAEMIRTWVRQSGNALPKTYLKLRAQRVDHDIKIQHKKQIEDELYDPANPSEDDILECASLPLSDQGGHWYIPSTTVQLVKL